MEIKKNQGGQFRSARSIILEWMDKVAKNKEMISNFNKINAKGTENIKEIESGWEVVSSR